jgi:selenocysteine lyase/cysteine desulfurase
VIAAVSRRAVPVPPVGIGRQQPAHGRDEIVVTAGPGLDDRDARGGVRHPDVQQAVTQAVDERLALAGDVPDRFPGSGPDRNFLAVHANNGSVALMRSAFGAAFDVPLGYLNTASVGIPPTFVADAMTEMIALWRTGSVQPPDYDKHVAAARDAWARLVGVPTSTVASGASVSQLVGLVAAGLPDGTRVVTVRQEFTSAIFPFAARGFTVDEVESADLASAVDDHDLVVVSVVQSADGTIAPLDDLRAAAAAAGARVLLDATQAVGWLPLHLEWADWVVGAGYKWLFAPRGSAWLSIRPDATELTRPLAANWYAGDDPWQTVYGMPLRLAPDARRFDLSPVWFSVYGAAVALPYLADLDLSAVRDHNVGLADTTLKALDLPPRGSAIISLDLPDAADRLTAAGAKVSVRAGRARLSFHLYNTEDDVDLVVRSLSGAR